MLTRALFIPVLICGLASCSLFNKEQKQQSLVFNYDLSSKENEALIKQYIASSNLQMLAMIKQNAQQCITGQVSIAQSLLQRAENELAGGLYNDAFISLVEFDRQMRKMRCIYNYLNGAFGCVQSNKTSVLKKWYLEGEFEQCELDFDTKEKSVASLGVHKHTIITETLYDFDQDVIKPIYHEALDKLVALMEEHPQSQLSVVGHADSQGDENYNLLLGEKRAKLVAQYFINKGIPVTKITTRSKGEQILREKETNSTSRVFNRHSLITLTLDSTFQENSLEADYE